ncbi:MAG: hypothetical protein AMS24_03015 [Chlamydiae bacterium SM23_39]|nr:MAG: hypothetical protein AMS24_03015 [Chlamydiae bacterium SM23_39]
MKTKIVSNNTLLASEKKANLQLDTKKLFVISNIFSAVFGVSALVLCTALPMGKIAGLMGLHLSLTGIQVSKISIPVILAAVPFTAGSFIFAGKKIVGSIKSSDEKSLERWRKLEQYGRSFDQNKKVTLLTDDEEEENFIEEMADIAVQQWEEIQVVKAEEKIVFSKENEEIRMLTEKLEEKSLRERKELEAIFFKGDNPKWLLNKEYYKFLETNLDKEFVIKIQKNLNWFMDKVEEQVNEDIEEEKNQFYDSLKDYVTLPSFRIIKQRILCWSFNEDNKDKALETIKKGLLQFFKSIQKNSNINFDIL